MITLSPKYSARTTGYGEKRKRKKGQHMLKSMKRKIKKGKRKNKET
jgi:hypothetical protein